MLVARGELLGSRVSRAESPMSETSEWVGTMGDSSFSRRFPRDSFSFLTPLGRSGAPRQTSAADQRWVAGAGPKGSP